MVWSSIIGKFRNIVHWWKLRNLTTKGKVIVINSLCVSLLTHALSVTDLPGCKLHELNSINKSIPLEKGKKVGGSQNLDCRVQGWRA